MIDWQATRLLDEPVPQADTDVVEVGGERYFPVSEMGFAMLTAALAGSANLCRVSGTRRGPVQMIEQTADGERRWLEPWTPEDDDAVDDDIAAYLEEAGIPAPPRGVTWLQRLPAGFADKAAVTDFVYRRMAAAKPVGVREAQIRAALEPIVAEMYQ